jgi:hypothetical protein
MLCARMIPMKRNLLIATGIVLAIILYAGRQEIRDLAIEWSKPAVPSEQPRPTPAPAVITRPAPSLTPQATPTPFIGAVNLAVPFQSQAPRGDWSLPWQEACEEASSILVEAYWRGIGLTVDEMERRILALVAWERSHFGYYEQTTSAQTAQMIREVYGYKKVTVKYDATISDIEDNVRAGRPVIVPMAGRLLHNPYYTAPGPIYHMLVVKGIAANGDIITNDVGTRHGYNYMYSPSVFLNAMHDLPQGGSDFPAGVDQEQWIETGRRAIIIVYPN